MNEVRQDYYDKLHEQNLTRHRSIVSKPRIPSNKELQAKNKPCVTIVYPKIDTLAGRIKYLQGAMTTYDFCKRIGIGMATYSRYIKGETEVPDDSLLKRIAQDLGCPLEWLKDGNREPTIQRQTLEESEETMEKENKADASGINITLCGKYTVEQLMQVLKGVEAHTFLVRLELNEAPAGGE